MEISHIEAAIEAILFASGDAVPFEKICLALELDKKTVKLVINNMMMKYNQEDRGILLREIGNGY